MQYAKALAEANLLPAAYRKQPANVLLAMEYGDALGLSPIAAIQGVHIIDGKPTASAQLIGALVRKAGHRLRVKVSSDGSAAKATIIRRDDPEFEFESVWTLERAQGAGLLGKGTWKQYPAAMLKSRAITEVARDACPEVLSGVAYTAEELGHDDMTVTVERVVTEIDHTWDMPDPEPEPAPVRKGGRSQAPATPAQRQFIGRFVREIGYEDTAMFLTSPDARTILGALGEDDHGQWVTAEQLTKAQASTLIDAFKRFHDEQPVEAEVVDEQAAGDDYEAGR
jgi:hypothetical protein